jgi:succinate dehydrogenase/fumarate reductase-like Fe-S protein
MQVHLKIFRFNPDVESVPHYQTYVIPWTEGLTLLNAVRWIYRTTDPTLAYRNYFCGRGLCGGCRMTVDGMAKKSCHVVLEPNREYLVEPLRSFPLIRDLVVDFGIRRMDPATGKEFTLRQGASIA